MNLIKCAWTPRATFAVVLAAGAVSLSGCSKADENVAAAPPAATAAAPAAAGQVGTPITAPVPPPIGPPPAPTAEAAAWTPQALDELMAPIALYPEPVLAQVLAASTNSQEVLDAGNWLLDNQTLKGDALTKAAAGQGFSPAVQALVQFPTVMDMMCRELDWTKQLGDAFSADQGAVLASVQRLRAQAAEVGNLKTSPQMTVDKSVQEGKTIIEIKPADPQVVYVPQYNPTTVYTAPPAAAPATTTTTTESNSSGLTTNEAVMGGILAFGAGVLVANLFDDDDDHYGYGYPNYGYGGVYYGGRPYSHNTFIYAPRGAGYRPAGGYRPPAGYGNRYNNTNINVNNNINSNNNYHNRFDKNQNRVSGYQAKSPVTGNRAATGGGNGYRGQGQGGGAYKGANAARTPGATAGTGTGNRVGQAGTTGAYKGSGQNRQASQAAQRGGTSQRSSGGADRGYPQVSGGRPDASTSQKKGGSFNGASANQGGRDRAASERGRTSMQSAPRPSTQQRASGGGSRSGSGGGGGRSRSGGGGGGGGGGRGGR